MHLAAAGNEGLVGGGGGGADEADANHMDLALGGAGDTNLGNTDLTSDGNPSGAADPFDDVYRMHFP